MAVLVLALLAGVYAVLRVTGTVDTGTPGATGSSGAAGSSGSPAGDPPPLHLAGTAPVLRGTPDPRYHLAAGLTLPDGPGAAEVRRPGAAGATAYPLVTARQAWAAVRRTPLPMPLMACREPSPGSGVPVDPVPCGLPVTVTGARLGTSTVAGADGPLELPTWELAVAGSPRPLTWLAVLPRLLAYDGPVPGGSVSGTPQPGGGSGAPQSRFTAVARGADDRSLEVTFWGGVAECYSYDVRSAETATDVRLTLVEHRSTAQQVCIDLAQQLSRTVRLGGPLGPRAVVDAATGETLLGPTR